MNKLFLVSLITLSSLFSEGFILITSLYKEGNPKRAEEYLYCLEKNLAQRLIKEIIVIYDGKEADQGFILPFLKEHKLRIIFHKGRPSFGEIFELANNMYPNEKIIIANGDIYFNETLSHLEFYDFENKFICLTRWDVKKDGSLQLFLDGHGKPKGSSHDAWIFKAPLRKFEQDHFKLGTVHCDPKIAYYAYKAEYDVINPCLSIQGCHYHVSGIRKWVYRRTPPNCKAITGTYLESIN